MGSCMALLIWLLLILLPMQCNARPGPFMEHHYTEVNKEEARNVDDQQQEPTSVPRAEILPAGNASGLFRGLTSHSTFRYVFNFLPKGVPIPPSGPSPGHNSKTDGADPNGTKSDP